MNDPDGRHKPRPFRWAWQTMRDRYRQQYPRLPAKELEERAKRMTRELNRMEDCCRYLDWQALLHERPGGLLPGERDSLDDNDFDHA